MFRFCLVGFGRWGKVYYETINRLDCCTLDCIVLSGSNTSNYHAVAVPIFYQIEEVIKSRQVDGFIIATPPETHFNLARICLTHKYPVIVEKPCTKNFMQASQLADIAKSNNTMCMVGYQHLFAESYISLKKLIDTGLSNLIIYSEGLSNGPFRSNVSVFRDWGSHEFAIAINLFKEIPFSYTVNKIAGNKEDSTKGVYFMELNFSLNRRYFAIFGNISEVKRRTLIATYQGGWAYLNGLDQGGCVVMVDGSILKPESILSAGIMPVDLMLGQFVAQSLGGFNFESLNFALEIVSLLDKIESELVMENSNV